MFGAILWICVYLLIVIFYLAFIVGASEKKD